MTIHQLATKYGKANATISRWIERGLPRNGTEAEIDEWVKGNIKAPGRPTTPQGESTKDAQRRKWTAQAALAELELAERRGKLIKRTEVEKSLNQIFTYIRHRLEGLPSQLSPHLAGLPVPQIEAKIRDTITEVLQHLSKAPDDTIRT